MMKFSSIHNCNNCSLKDNQLPLLDSKYSADVMWVGLSAVKVDDVEKDIPLSSKTNSGKLIDSIEDAAGNIQFYKTNLVKCLPLKENKIRYPNSKEMSDCYGHLVNEIDGFRPKVIFLLGMKVYDFISKKENAHISCLNQDFDYEELSMFGTTVVPIHHPSYILIYKRRWVESYISAVSGLCAEYGMMQRSDTSGHRVKAIECYNEVSDDNRKVNEKEMYRRPQAGCDGADYREGLQGA